MIISPARRTEGVREYYFSIKNRQLAAIAAERVREGLPPLINLGIGAPDGMPPQAAIEALRSSAALPTSHKYQNYRGLPELREAFCRWYSKWYGVNLDPECEVQPLVGSKEGILLTSLAFVNEGDKVLVPDPGYPTYVSASKLVGAQIVTYRLDRSRGWLPDFEELEKMNLEGVKIMWVNYPNMPTGAPASMELFERLVEFGRKHNVLIINDNPYSFILTGGKPLSILSVPGSKECCLELNSLSKSHNMSGWRIGMVAGASEYIAEILKVKSQMDSGMFKPLQEAAVQALSQGQEWYDGINGRYASRQKSAQRLLDAIGASWDEGQVGLFVWGEVSEDNPFLEGTDSSKTLGERVSDALLARAGVFLTPGYIFGHGGDNYLRASLCASAQVIDEAARRIRSLVGKE